MPKWTLTTLLTLAAAGTLTTQATAQTALDAATCGDRANVIDKLSARFGEAQTGAGIVSDNRVLELWQSDNGSWTILMTRPDGTTCIMAAGDFWRDKAPDKGDPA